MKIFGIDPGLSGAIAILQKKKVLNLFDMPVMAEGKKNKKQLNSAQLVNIIRENSIGDDEIAVVVEQVNAMPGQGVTSMFNFGQTFGAIKGVCAALNLPIFFVRPSKWKKYFERHLVVQVQSVTLTSFCFGFYLSQDNLMPSIQLLNKQNFLFSFQVPF